MRRMIIMKKKISLVKADKLVDKFNENEIYEDMMQSKFYEWMTDNGYDKNTLIQLFNYKKVDAIEQSNFNIILKKVKEELDIDIHVSFIYLYEKYDKWKKIYALLDDEILNIIKCELKEKYRICEDEVCLDELEESIEDE